MSCWELEQALSNFTGNLKRIVFYRIQVAQEHVSTMIDCWGQFKLPNSQGGLSDPKLVFRMTPANRIAKQT